MVRAPLERHAAADRRNIELCLRLRDPARQNELRVSSALQNDRGELNCGMPSGITWWMWVVMMGQFFLEGYVGASGGSGVFLKTCSTWIGMALLLAIGAKLSHIFRHLVRNTCWPCVYPWMFHYYLAFSFSTAQEPLAPWPVQVCEVEHKYDAEEDHKVDEGDLARLQSEPVATMGKHFFDDINPKFWCVYANKCLHTWPYFVPCPVLPVKKTNFVPCPVLPVKKTTMPINTHQLSNGLLRRDLGHSQFRSFSEL